MSEPSQYEDACDVYKACMLERGFDAADFGPDEWEAHTLAIAAVVDAERERVLKEFEGCADGRYGGDCAQLHAAIFELIAKLRAP